MENNKEPKDGNKEKSKEIYFIIFFDNKNKIKSDDLKFENHEKIDWIFTEEEIEEGNESKFKYKMVFKQTRKIGKKNEEISIKFKAIEDEYSINFNINSKIYFLFDLKLKVYNRFFKREKDILQNNIDYFDKVKIFNKALENNNEENKIPILLNNAINIYFDNPRFPLLIKLFTKVYENKELCSLLLQKFDSTKDKNNQINSIITNDLESFKENIIAIYEEADNLIMNFSYVPINFYGLILSYLNNYDYDKFVSLLGVLYEKSKEILFNILVVYKSYFKQELKCGFNFYDDFISYSTSKSYDEFINNCLIYLKDINLFLKVLEHHKEKIISIQKFNPILVIDIDNKLKLDIKNIINLIEKIIDFSEEKNKLLIFFNYQFWENIVYNYSTAIQENITICYTFRNLFERYYILVTKIFEKKESKIKEDATLFHNNQFYDSLLDKNILKYIDNEKNIDNINIISLIKGYDIYYANNIDDKKYSNKRTVEIFNKIIFEKVDEEFINEFKKCNFEIKFKDQIDKYLLKLFSKVKSIEDFNIILKLINIDNLASKKDTYLTLLKEYYDSLIINAFSFQVEKNDEKKYEKIIDSIAFLTNFLCKHENNFNFLSDKIGNLDKKRKYDIYIKLIEEKEISPNLIEYIKKLYLKELYIGNIQYFIEFVRKLKILKNEDYNFLIDKLTDFFLVESDDFYMYGNNIKIELLKNLISNNIIEDNDNYYKSTSKILTSSVYRQIEEKNIEIKHLNSFFKNEDNIILERLNILNKFKLKERLEPKEKLKILKEIKVKIDNILNELTIIRESLKIYHKLTYKDEISDINNIISKINEGTNKEYDQDEIKIKRIIDKFKNIVNDTNKVKCSKIFAVFYKCLKKQELKEDIKFKKALQNYNTFIDALHKNKDKNKDISKILNQLKKEINIKDKNDIKEINNELKNIMKQDIENIEDNECFFVFNIKIYEEYVNSIFFFFAKFKKEDKKWSEFLSKKYMNLSEKGLDNFQLYLKELKEKGIYDFKNKLNESNYLAMFKCLYGKDQVYDFLLTKTIDYVDLLIDRIEGSTLTIKDIKDASDCIGIFQELKHKKNNFEILMYVKRYIKDETLNKFINFSTKFISIQDLYQNFDSSKLVFKNVKNIISKGKFIFRQDNEEFSYYENGKEKVIIINP